MSLTDAPIPETVTRPNPDRIHLGIALILFVVTLSVYIATACRTLYTGDDGDFITAMVTTGIPHPTGYPLFLLMGKLFLLLPFGDMPFRINLMTALFGAASVAMLYRFLAQLVPYRFLAATGALLFAFSPTLWQQSLSCEVYSLTCLFLTTLLYLLRRWWDTPEDNRLLFLLGATYGLSMTNHLTMLLFLPGFLVVVLLRRNVIQEGRVLGTLTAFFLVPLSLYLYLLLAANLSDSPVKWGNPTTLPALVSHMTGAQYRGFMFSHLALIPLHARDYASYLPQQFGWWFLLLAPVGAFAWLRSPDSRSTRPLLWLLLYIFVANILYAFNYFILDIYVYYLPSYIVTITLITLGIHAALSGLFSRLQLPQEQQQRYLTLIVPIFLTIPIVQMSLNYAETDKSGNYIEADFARNTLLSAPKNAILVERRDQVFALWYRQFVLKERPDVTVISASLFAETLRANSWYRLHLRPRLPEIDNVTPVFAPTLDKTQRGDLDTDATLYQFLRPLIQKGRPIFLVAWPDLTEPTSPEEVSNGKIPYEKLITRDFTLVPWGIGERVYPKGKTPSPESLYGETAPLWNQFSRRGLYTGWAQAERFQQHLILRYADAGVAFAQLAESQKQYDVAANEYANTLRLYKIPASEEGLARCKAALGQSSAAP